MTTWWKQRCLAVDLETSGISVFDDRIVTACAAIVAPDGTVEFQRDWLLDPGVEIPAAASEVHGISTEHAREHGMDAATGVKEIANAIRYAVRSNLPVVAFNAAYDLSLLNAECVRHGLGTLAEFCDAPIRPVIDPFCIDRAVDKYRKGKRQLGVVCEHYGVELKDAHTAGADALAAVAVARRLAERCGMHPIELGALYADRRYPSEMVRAFQNLGRLSLHELHEQQVGWYRQLSEDLARYWRGQAEELRHRISNATDDEARAVAAQELAELEARIDSVRTEWPIAPLVAQGELL